MKRRTVKKESASWFKKKLDIIFSKIVREKGVCERCGSRENLQCSHVIPRTHLGLRWDFSNALCLCVKCHLYWWHKNVLEAGEWFKSKFPQRYKYLQERKSLIKKYTISEYRDMYLEFKNWNK